MILRKKSKVENERSAQRKNAMPEVKKLVIKYGRSAVMWCINQMRDHEKKIRALENAKREVELLEKNL